MSQRANRNISTFAIETHGCKLNQADTLVLAREFTEAGLTQVDEDKPADIYVVNSCTVTHVADRKARHSIRAARRRNPFATIVATGCYAERSPEQLKAIEEIDLVFGNVAKARLVQQVVEWSGDAVVPCAVGDEPEYIVPSVRRTRAMVKIQEGCNQICAYCIVPKVRGRERSMPTDSIVGDIRRLVSDGYKEVVLTGTQLGSYGFDLADTTLVSLLESILTQTEIERLRVSSMQPQEFTDDLLRLWNDERLCPHFHMPLQSGSDRILNLMRRRYTSDEYADVVRQIHSNMPHASVTADVIVGFPGESDADFQETYDLCESIYFADLHVFPYSLRPGTSAAYYDNQVSPMVMSERMNALLSLAKTKAYQFRRDSIGVTRPVLWESQVSDGDDVCWVGLTDNYIRVRAHRDQALLNTVTPATLTSVYDDRLVNAEIRNLSVGG